MQPRERVELSRIRERWLWQSEGATGTNWDDVEVGAVGIRDVGGHGGGGEVVLVVVSVCGYAVVYYSGQSPTRL